MRRNSRFWLMAVLVLCLGAGPWAHALVTSAAGPQPEHCASHDTASGTAVPAHIADCCKVDAGGCSCAAASLIPSLPTVATFHAAGFEPLVYVVEPHSADLTAVFRPPI